MLPVLLLLLLLQVQLPPLQLLLLLPEVAEAPVSLTDLYTEPHAHAKDTPARTEP